MYRGVPRYYSQPGDKIMTISQILWQRKFAPQNGTCMPGVCQTLLVRNLATHHPARMTLQSSRFSQLTLERIVPP